MLFESQTGLLKFKSSDFIDFIETSEQKIHISIELVWKQLSDSGNKANSFETRLSIG